MGKSGIEKNYSKYFVSMVLSCAFVLTTSPAASAFYFQDVVKLAKKRASKAYVASKSAPSFLTGLTYDQYRKIRFSHKAYLWHNEKSKFQIAFVTPGYNFKHVVNMHVIDMSGVRKIPFNKGAFTWPNKKIKKKVPKDLGYAGFRLTYPLNGTPQPNQFLAFAGVSYFRGVARDQNFGLSARGIAVDTGLMIGEKFPSFTDFWFIKPSPTANSFEFYALLDGPSLTGAYRFVVTPGDITHIKVRAVLFLRKDIKLLGYAPLTSMFYYGRNTPRPANMWRGAIHDSDGLLIHSSTGEWLWHPLINPPSLQMEYLTANSPKGFGLMQRLRDFKIYQDAQARYDARPSAWVQPEGDWGKGRVVLVKIPTNSEYNDNIVAFWSPDKDAKAGDRRAISYTLSFGGSDMTGEPLGKVANTFVGNPKDNKYRFIIDFNGGSLGKLLHDAKVKAVVSATGGAKILHHYVEWIKPLGQWRLSLLVKAAPGKQIFLRGFLKSEKKTLTETWTYTLPAENRINNHGS